MTANQKGAFRIDLDVVATFVSQDGVAVDCRAAPGCVVFTQGGRHFLAVTVPLSFRPARP